MKMKKKLLLFVFSMLLLTGKATDYYWNPDFMAGNINWTDLNNWYTTSGGTINPSVLPGPADDIYIDSNSSYPVMAIDDTATCRSVYIGNFLTGIPEINDMGFYGLHVYGSFYGHDSLSINTNIFFASGVPGNQIDLNAPYFQLSSPLLNLSVSFVGAGEWTLIDDLVANVVSVENGTFKSNDKLITVRNFLIQGTVNRTVLLGQSTIEVFDVGSGFLVYGSNYSIDADSADIILTVGDNIILAFAGGTGQHYHYVEMDTLAPVAGISGTNCEIDHLVCYGSIQDLTMTGVVHKGEFFGGASISNPGTGSSAFLHYDTLILDNTVPGGLGPNNSYFIDADSLFVNDVIIVNSGLADTISITSVTPNMLVLPSDTICLDYIKLQNSNALGSGYYFAGNNSVDLGSNSGWTFTNCVFGSVGVTSFENEDIKIFPNPASSILTIESEKKIRSCKLYTITGQIVHPEINANSEEQLFVGLGNLQNGLYMIELITDNGIIRKKITKQ